MTARELHIGYVPVRALRISYVGELGWEIYTPTEFGAELWTRVARGRAARRRGLRRRGLRHAAPREGLPALGPTSTRSTTPTRRDSAASSGSTRATHRPQAARGSRPTATARKLCCLMFDDPSARDGGQEPLLDGDRALGYVTSAATARLGRREHPVRLRARQFTPSRHDASASQAHSTTTPAWQRFADPLLEPANKRRRSVAAPARAPGGRPARFAPAAAGSRPPVGRERNPPARGSLRLPDLLSPVCGHQGRPASRSAGSISIQSACRRLCS